MAIIYSRSILRALPSPPVAVILSVAGFAGIALILRRLLTSIELTIRAGDLGQQLSDRARVLHARPPSSFVRHFLTGAPARADGVPMKEFMYTCFEQDVQHGARVENVAIPTHQPGQTRRLRMVSFNVHFFRAGYSTVVRHDASDEILDIIRSLNADLLLLQEVPASEKTRLMHKLQAWGYEYAVAAPSAEVHTLPPDSAAYPNERLQAMLPSKQPPQTIAS